VEWGVNVEVVIRVMGLIITATPMAALAVPIQINFSATMTELPLFVGTLPTEASNSFPLGTMFSGSINLDSNSIGYGFLSASGNVLASTGYTKTLFNLLNQIRLAAAPSLLSQPILAASM